MLPARPTIFGVVFDADSIGRPLTDSERRFVKLLALAADDSPAMFGVDGNGRHVGDWSNVTAGELRRIRERDQESLFGRIVTAYDPKAEVRPTDGDEFTLPPDAVAKVNKTTKSPGTSGWVVASGGEVDGASETASESTGSAAVKQRDSGNAPSSQPPADGSIDRTCTEREIVDKIKLDVLGKLPGGAVKVFSLFHRRTEIIRDVGKMTYEHLLMIAGPDVKEYVLKSNVDDVPGAYSFHDVREAIALLAGYRTIGDRTELGVGCWEGIERGSPDEVPVVLVGAGEAAYWNGDRVLHRIDYPRAKGHLLDFESGGEQWYDYPKLAHLLHTMDNGQMASVKDECIEIFSRWQWKSASAPLVAAGLVFASFVQSVWDWRPQIAVTGESNSGKSYLWIAMERLFGKLALRAAKPSAAGLRQAIGNTSRIVLIDEFEKDRHRAEILEMLRASSRGDKIPRGTPGQKAVTSALKNIAWVTAIEVGLNAEADKNRFISLELVKPPPERAGKLVMPTVAELSDLGQRALAVAIRCIERARPLATKLRDTRVPGVDTRIVESYAVPAAMLAAIDGSTDEEAREILRLLLEDLDKDEIEVDIDKLAVLREIMGSQIQSGNVRLTAAQWLDIVIRQQSKHEEAETVLARSGIKFSRFTAGEARKAVTEGGGIGIEEGDPCLVLAHKHIHAHLLRNTQWDGKRIDTIISRIAGATRGNRNIGSLRQRTVLIPWAYISEEVFGDSTDAPASTEPEAAAF